MSGPADVVISDINSNGPATFPFSSCGLNI